MVLMPVYAIMTKALAEGLDQLISHSYPDNVRWSDTVWFASTTDSAQAICQNLGVSEPNQPPITSRFGHIIVIQVTGNYWGFGNPPFWSSLKTSFERQPQ